MHLNRSMEMDLEKMVVLCEGFGDLDEQDEGVGSAVNSATTSNSVTVYLESRAEFTQKKISDLDQELVNE